MKRNKVSKFTHKQARQLPIKEIKCVLKRTCPQRKLQTQMTPPMRTTKHLMKKLYHLYKLSENTGGKFIHYRSEYKRVQCFGNHYGISEKIKPVLPCNPAIPLLGF